MATWATSLVTFGVVLVGVQTPAHAGGTCDFWVDFDRNITGAHFYGSACLDSWTGETVLVGGTIKDTKADGKCARYQVSWVTSNYTRLRTDTVSVCGNGNTNYFESWNTLDAWGFLDGISLY
ncbi:hypothetical protein Rhe02_34660 [Rhizocola hellebori]|uniref:Uncharacterized protein n=1 Tax=Rhizocola hellebori TaxID=1392758 RepID=A0A8J3Q7G8_9ACTN|nr:hypothetical protein Rhe02_34660 [Rhizocola hellebori]